MKKLLSTLGIFGCIAFASTAFAAADTDATTITNLTDFTTSNNVKLTYDCTGRNTPAGQDYYLMTKHTAGDRIFAATNNSNPTFQEDDAYKGLNIAETIAAGSLTTPTEGDNTEALDTNSWRAL